MAVHVIKTFAIDGSQWWPIAAPIACSFFSLRGPADFHIRTDATDPTTEDDVPPGIQEGVTAGHTSYRPPTWTAEAPFAWPRWNAGDVVLYAKSQGAAQVLVGRFIQ